MPKLTLISNNQPTDLDKLYTEKESWDLILKYVRKTAVESEIKPFIERKIETCDFNIQKLSKENFTPSKLHEQHKEFLTNNQKLKKCFDFLKAHDLKPEVGSVRNFEWESSLQHFVGTVSTIIVYSKHFHCELFFFVSIVSSDNIKYQSVLQNWTNEEVDKMIASRNLYKLTTKDYNYETAIALKQVVDKLEKKETKEKEQDELKDKVIAFPIPFISPVRISQPEVTPPDISLASKVFNLFANKTIQTKELSNVIQFRPKNKSSGYYGGDDTAS